MNKVRRVGPTIDNLPVSGQEGVSGHSSHVRALLKDRARRTRVRVQSFIIDTYYRASLFQRRLRGKVTHVSCLVPFTTVEFCLDGIVTACCPAFTKVDNIGNMRDHTIEEIWNCREIQRFRRFILLDRTNTTCYPNCPYQKPTAISEMKTETKRDKTLKNDLLKARTKLHCHPSIFNLSNYEACNLHCIMCGRDHRLLPGSHPPDYVARTAKDLEHYFGEEITIVLTGNGDPLARRDTRELLQSFPADRYPNVRFALITNGLLLNRKMWEQIKHCNFTWANVSIDAATKQTYEKIRRGGKWEVLMESLQILKEAKAEGKFSDVAINMTVMRSNYKEITLFVETARRFGFRAIFSKIRGHWGDENIFELNDEEALEHLREILSDPALYGEDVDIVQLSDYTRHGLLSRI